MFGVYVCVFGTVLAMMGIVEIAAPVRSFSLWKIWIKHRLFFIHGALLISLGLPLACTKTVMFPTLVFIIGLVLVFTGPFILLYADRIRKVFLSATEDMSKRSVIILMLADATVRLSAGIVLIYASGLPAGF